MRARRPGAVVWAMGPALAAALLAGLAVAADERASDPPAVSATPVAVAPAALTAEELRRAVAQRAGPLWTVETVSVEPAPAGSGEDLRLTARVRLAQPTYVIAERDGPVTFIYPAAEAGLEKVLVGGVGVEAADGGWTHVVSFDNEEVLDSVGRPAGELPGRTVVAGTEQARAVRAELTRDAEQRLAAEKARAANEADLLAQATAAADAEVERAAAELRAVEARIHQIVALRAKLLGENRPDTLAAYEAAIGGDDVSLRQLALEAALRSRDPLLANLALRDWLGRRKDIPIQLYATREDPTSETVLQNLGPLTLVLDAFNPISGALSGTLGAPGYSITRPSAAVGALAQTELTVNAFGCGLILRLTEHQTLDGLYRCQSLPVLIARVTLG